MKEDFISDNASKTRLSILFYSLAWDGLKIAESATHVLAVFEDTMPTDERTGADSTVPVTPQE